MYTTRRPALYESQAMILNYGKTARLARPSTQKHVLLLAQEITAVLYYRVNTWRPQQGYSPDPGLIKPPVDLLPMSPPLSTYQRLQTTTPDGRMAPISFLVSQNSTLTSPNVSNQGPTGLKMIPERRIS
eukprot:g70319.t1